MIEEQALRIKALKNQTTLRNVGREYLQNLFLTSFYKKAGSENFLFKGGTALRLVFGSPRFSEDLDFSGVKDSVTYEDVLEEVLGDLSMENLKIELLDSKPTSGGHLAILGIDLFGEKFELSQEISFRKPKSLEAELTLVVSDLVPAYRIYLLDKKMLVLEKLSALLARQKPRDFFDLYFILRNEELRRMLKIDSNQRRTIFSLLEKADKIEIGKELRMLLPKSFWPIIKDLPEGLKRELERG